MVALVFVPVCLIEVPMVMYLVSVPSEAQAKN